LDIKKVIVFNLHVASILDLKINCSSGAHLSVAHTNFYRPRLVTWTYVVHHRAGHQAVTALTALSANEPAAVGGRHPTCATPPLALSLHEAERSSPHFHFPLPHTHTLLCSTPLSSATTVHLSHRPSQVIGSSSSPLRATRVVG
jgi:hypothetical protein